MLSQIIIIIVFFRLVASSHWTEHILSRTEGFFWGGDFLPCKFQPRQIIFFFKLLVETFEVESSNQLKQMLCSKGRRVQWGSKCLQGKHHIRVVGTPCPFEGSSVVPLYMRQMEQRIHTHCQYLNFISSLLKYMSIIYLSQPSIPSPNPLLLSPVPVMC